MNPFELLALLCWGVFVAAWIVGAVYNWLNAPKLIGERNWWTTVPRLPLIVIPMIVLLRLLPRSVVAAMYFWNIDLAVLGFVLLVLSTAFTLWARWTLGTMWSPVPTLKQHHELRTAGPYRITRHPIYTGMLGMLLGSVLMAGFGPLVLAPVIAGAVFLARIAREEQLMLDAFGDQYVRYRRAVPRLVPFLHV